MKESNEQPGLLLPDDGQAPSRRAFLEIAGFGLSAAALAGCSPGRKTTLVPGLDGPESYVAGNAYHVATACGGCASSCGVLAKCRDGRPIKLEGNELDSISGGGLCATGQGELLSLYDSKRLNAPRAGGELVSWGAADASIIAALAKSGSTRLLTGTENGPSTRSAIAGFLSRHAGAQHIAYDALSVSALLDAQQELFGVRVLPSFAFDRAQVIVSFAADFLGTWIAPVAFARDYARGRRPEDGNFSMHVQLEGHVSMTGTVADRREQLSSSERFQVLDALCRNLEQRSKGFSEEPAEDSYEHAELVAELGELLWEARGHALVVLGDNDKHAQLQVSQLNSLLGNYGETLSLTRPSLQRMGDDSALWQLKSELDAGAVDCLILSGVNPAYDLPASMAASLRKAATLVVHSGEDTESAALADFVLPAAHGLESWGDAEPIAGSYVLRQPLLPNFRKTRTLRELLARWGGDSRDDAELLRAHWREQLHPHFGMGRDFDYFFTKSLNDGFVEPSRKKQAEPEVLLDGIRARSSVAEAGLELVLYPKVGLLDGRTAHNPWLQELPNPVTKATWDNYVRLAPERAESLGVGQGDLVRVELEDTRVQLPVLVQRGQHPDVVAIALGYGRLGTDRFSEVGPSWLEGIRTVQPGETVGANVAPFLRLDEGGLCYSRAGIKLAKAGGRRELAVTQEHHSLELPEGLASYPGQARDVVLTSSFADYQSQPERAVHGEHHAVDTNLWELDHEPPHHHWGMVVDLSSCNGCSACVISCQAENNVPVVGKDEVLRHREMHWMRIDRYFEGEGDSVTASHQPMFCQQCDNAPCESVCPVLATVHSSEGLNQQVYNRCVGTRYCANTCPYKVRRFNWFDYPREDKLQNHSLNPDVTIRTRGVMEKCSFCAQRIQEARSEAIRNGVELADGDIRVACQQSCPTQAIFFGDLMDPESQVSKVMERQRSYKVLEELNVKPSVSYLARIKNRGEEGAHHE